MSADNVIYVQKRLDGFWWVWMGFMSDDEPAPRKDRGAINFISETTATQYANWWYSSEAIVEYGVQMRAPEMKKQKVSNKKLIKGYIEDARKSLGAAYLLQQDTEFLSEKNCPFSDDGHWYGSWALASFVLEIGASNCPFCDAEFPVLWEMNEAQEEPEPPDLWEVADRIEDDLDDLRKRAAFDDNLEQ